MNLATFSEMPVPRLFFTNKEEKGGVGVQKKKYPLLAGVHNTWPASTLSVFVRGGGGERHPTNNYQNQHARLKV